MTTRGADRGRQILRVHRLMELWLQNVVKIEPRRAQATACAMQHSVVPEFEAWVCGQLGVPRHSPKDHAIPPCCPKGDKG